ncbi:uncharacterized protein LOC144867318 [Branchiostoma floridae x Branchiostoma japonicum]
MSSFQADKYQDDKDDDIIFLAAVFNVTSAAPPQDEMSEKATPSVTVLAPPPDNPPQRKERTPSVVVLGTPQKSRCLSSAGSPDPNGLLVTYARPADTVNYPHPRSACPHHPFSTADSSPRAPYITIRSSTTLQNEACCNNCFCYVCDQPAKECQVWTIHCNAHSKDLRWRWIRERQLNKTQCF